MDLNTNEQPSPLSSSPLTSIPAAGNSGFAELAASFQTNRLNAQKEQPKRKPKNNVWAEVAQAEEIQNTAEQFNVVSIIDKFIIKRGPESYEVGNKRKRPAQSEEGNKEQPKNKNCFLKRQKRSDTRKSGELESGESDDTDYESDSSISSGGLSDDCKVDLTKRSVAKKLAFQNADMTPKNPKKRTSREIMEEQMKEMEDWEVANFISNRLKESKKRLMQKVMKILEREKTLKLFWKTLKVERLGGLMIKNNSRRRTPGGVFLYLLRNDRRVDQEKIKEIFHEDREERKSQLKAEQLEKDQKFFSHLARVMKKKRPGAAKSRHKDDDPHANTDSEEEEMKDSYQLPPPKRVTFAEKPTFISFEAPGPLAPVLVTPSAPAPGFPQSSSAAGQDRKCISYDDDFLDISCEQEEFL